MNRNLHNLCETILNKKRRMSMIKSTVIAVGKKTRSHRLFHSSHLAAVGRMITRNKIIVMKTILRSLKAKMKGYL